MSEFKNGVGSVDTAELQEVAADCVRQSNYRTQVIPPVLVERMRVHLTGRADVHPMERFGISANTWLKIRTGEPIRYSVAERLLERLVSLADSDGDDI